ncbi:MAG TPA: C4-type zinc ribbon domain-containing protein [Anaerolineales bacterium]|nr:C4-type zinc ribbon domain-containing protein [Anaerolineales bacterium]
MSAALGLYRLQQVDSQIDQVQARLKAIRQTLENDAELRAATDRLSAADHKYKDTEQALKQREAEVQKQSIKIQQTESSLYGGSVHNPKELQELEMDAASLKRHLVTLEERELEAMLVVEAAEKDLSLAREEFERVQSSLGDQNRDLMQESGLLHRDLDRLNAERQAVISGIAQQAIDGYNQLRQQRRGIAVTTVSDSSCAACGTTLTPSQQQTARSTTQLFYCPSCGRILYAD